MSFQRRKGKKKGRKEERRREKKLKKNRDLGNFLYKKIEKKIVLYLSSSPHTVLSISFYIASYNSRATITTKSSRGCRGSF